MYSGRYPAIQLIPEGSTDAAYTTTVTGKDTTYVIENVAPGVYTLRVGKKNHITREYIVQVGG